MERAPPAVCRGRLPAIDQCSPHQSFGQQYPETGDDDHDWCRKAFPHSLLVTDDDFDSSTCGWSSRGEFLDFYREPLFSDGVTRGLLMHLTMLLFSAIVVLPLWLSGSQIDKYYTAPPTFNSTVQTLDNGWRKSPVQGHAHRFGPVYQGFIFIHVFGGLFVIFMSFMLIGFFITNNKMCGHPWLWQVRIMKRIFFIAWTIHLTVALVMAYCKMITHGMDPCNWTQSFSVGFFALFYFVVLIVLQSLMAILSYQFDRTQHQMLDEDSERPLSELGCTRCSTYGTLTMFMLGVFATFTITPGDGEKVMECNPKVAAGGDYGFDNTNYTILMACIAFGIQPVASIMFERAMAIRLFRGWVTAFMVELSYLTLYMVSILVEGLNITQYADSNALVVLIPCITLYAVAIVVHMVRVNKTTGLQIADHGNLFPCWFFLSKKEIGDMHMLITRIDGKLPPAYESPRTWPCCQFGRGMDAVILCMGWVVFALVGWTLGRYCPGGGVNFGIIGMFVGLAVGSLIAMIINQWLEEHTDMLVPLPDAAPVTSRRKVHPAHEEEEDNVNVNDNDNDNNVNNDGDTV